MVSRYNSKTNTINQSVLITGASGFIGKYLTASLQVSDCFSVYCVSRDEGFDISKRKWTRNIEIENVHNVVHLAQSRFYREFPEKSEDMVKVNIDATAELLDWSRTHGVKRFIFASTGNVYKSSTCKLNENSPAEPNSFYGATKLAAEQLVNRYQDYFQVINLRFFGVYGPNQKNMLIPNIIEKIIKGQEIQLAEGVGLYLTPLYIKDCIKIIKELIERQLRNRNCLFNISGPEIVSLRDIIIKLEKILMLKAIIRPTDDEVTQFVADNSRIDLLLDDMEYTPIDEGLKKTLS